MSTKDPAKDYCVAVCCSVLQCVAMSTKDPAKDYCVAGKDTAH